jgi:branched-chain amino acid transport system permease protein
LTILGLLWGGVYLLMAEGLNLIYGVMKVVNLAHGDFIVVGGLLAFTLFGHFGMSPLLTFPLAALILFGIGAGVQYAVLERITVTGPEGELRTLLTTFGLSYVVANASFLIWGSQFQSVPFLQQALVVKGIAIPQGLIAASAVAFAGALLVQLWLSKTMLGKAVHATAQSALGAATCGLDIRRIRTVTFGLGAAMAGAAGTLAITLIPLQTSSGGDLTVQAFTLIALGGLGNYTGAWIAAEILGLLEVFTQYFLNANVASAVVYAVFILVLILRPQGLLGKAGRI